MTDPSSPGHDDSVRVERSEELSDLVREAETTSAESETSADEPVLGDLDREIGLTLAHLRGLDDLERAVERSLLRSECLIGTELLRLNVPPRTYLPPYHRERWSLERGLLHLQSERRRLAVSLHEQRRSLLDRLAVLLGRRRRLAL